MKKDVYFCQNFRITLHFKFVYENKKIVIV
jgi:hypothetical protein